MKNLYADISFDKRSDNSWPKLQYKDICYGVTNHGTIVLWWNSRIWDEGGIREIEWDRG